MPLLQLTSRPAYYQPRNGRSPYSRRPRRGLISRLFTYGVIVIAVGCLVVLAAFAWYSRDLPDPSSLTHRTAGSPTTFYDRSGQTVIYRISSEQATTPVRLADLPPALKNAIITAEDREFYTHQGFNIRGMARALFVDLTQGSRMQGGSTITQQLIKNSIVGDEKSIDRKIRELLLAYRLDQTLPKDQVLELYLNSIPFGGTAYGVEEASKLYYGKSARELTLPEAAILAAMIKAPTRLSPNGNHRDELIARQHYVLNQMADLGYITTAQAKEAQNTEIKFSAPHATFLAPHFVLYARELLAQRYGEALVATGGLKVITTLDLSKQKIAEQAVGDGAVRNAAKYGATNAALVALDPKNGQILSMVGSYDYNAPGYGNVNVTIRPRQPGSSFKPIVYAASFMLGYSPDTVLFDVVTNFKTDTGANYTPHNYDGRERGPVTIRQALAGSLNIPAVKMLYLTGVNNVLNLADTLGYTTLKDRSRFGLALVLGGGEVTLLEHTAAFQAFAREGVIHPTTPILRVEDRHGNVLEQFQQVDQQAMPGNVAKLVTSILTDNAARAPIFGANSPLQMLPRVVGAKTGTTNDWHDGWTIGFTPSIVTGVWAGNNDNTAMKRNSDGVLVAAPIWHQFMQGVLGNTPLETFNPPSPVPQTKPVLRGDPLTTQKLTIDTRTNQPASPNTPVEFMQDILRVGAHTILTVVNPEQNPNDPAPRDPTKNSNYASWEMAIRRWVTKHPMAGEKDIPIGAGENNLGMLITAPPEAAVIATSNLEVSVVAASPVGIQEIIFQIDGNQLATSNGSGTISIPLQTISAGQHQLTVIVTDQTGVKINQSRNFIFQPDQQ